MNDKEQKESLELALTSILRVKVEFGKGDYKEQLKKLIVLILKKEEKLMNAYYEFKEIGEYVTKQMSYSKINKSITKNSTSIILNVVDREIEQIKGVYYTIFEAFVYFDFFTEAIENALPNLRKAIDVMEKSKSDDEEDKGREIVNTMKKTIDDNFLEDLDDDEIFELINNDLQMNLLDKPEYQKYLE